MWASLSLVTKCASLTFIIAAAIRAGAALSAPSTDGDSLLYHLPMTAALIQDHSMWFTRTLLYPGARELGEALGAATMANVVGVVAFQMVELVMLVLVSFGWARRAGASMDGAAGAAIVVGSLPLVVEQMFTSENDVFVCALLAAACVLWRVAPRLAALALGLTFATKLTAFLLAPAVAAVMLVFEGWPFSLRDVAWGLAFAAPWYVRTLALTGNAIYLIGSARWNSTIEANFAASWFWTLTAIRNWGGLAAILGVPVLLLPLNWRGQQSFVKASSWLALTVYLAWLVMPYSAETVPGTLEHIRDGWSLRYAEFLPFVLVMGLMTWLDRIERAPVTAFVALVSAAFALARSWHISQPLGPTHAFPVVVCVLLGALALWASQRPVARALLVSCLAVASLAASAGSKSIGERWNTTYLQWTTLIPANAILADPRIQASKQVAVLGLRSFPFVGPAFQRLVYEEAVARTATAWIDSLRRRGVSLLVASGATGSINQPGFLKPLPEEAALAATPGVCLVAIHGFVRIYDIDPWSCPHRHLH